MTMCDDRLFILSLIQNSYITSDDTGICEEILTSETPKNIISEQSFHSDEEYGFAKQKPGISSPSSPDISSNRSKSRYRTYTERKSERIKKERENASRVKRIFWKSKYENCPLTEEELSEMFTRKVGFDKEVEDPLGSNSLLSIRLAYSENAISNPYIEYSKFDGVTHNNVSTKQLRIFLHVSSNPSLDYPLQVCVVSSAKVSELIGLICWLYTKEDRQPSLKSVDHYDLFIAEEDGQYDLEFHPLEKIFSMDKYRFTTLAFVEKDEPDVEEGLVVTVNFAAGVFSKVEVQNTEVVLKEVLRKSISRRKDITRIKETGVDYHLEKENEPGVALSLDMTLGQVQCTEFAAVRDNSCRLIEDELIGNDSIRDLSLPQLFTVTWVHKFVKYCVKVELSLQKFEVIPLSVKTGSRFLQTRLPPPLNYSSKHLIDCYVKPLKRNRVEVIITVRGEYSFKGFRLRSERVIGEILFNRCHRIIKFNSSNVVSSVLEMRCDGDDKLKIADDISM